MANKTIDALVYCPFYICEGKNSITCEGLIGDKITNHFVTTQEKKDYENNFCTSKCCRGCTVYTALSLKYQ
ncbi:MAG: hypothetical protein IKK26_03195 [Clostridia bacterium]|nr:hypothetical protein [Clostridia bacterium]